MVPVMFEQRNILGMILDKARDQLITNGAYGTKFWIFQPKKEKHLNLGKGVSNFELIMVEHSEHLGGSWVKFAEIDYAHDYLYYCSETDVHCYNLAGSDRAGLIFKLENCHRMEITGCLYSNTQEVLVTSSMDTELKLWNTNHGYLATLMGHSQGITGMYFYPNDQSRIITASMDGSVRIWSLCLRECQLVVPVLSSEPVLWSGMVNPRQMFVASNRRFALLQINYLPVLWSECNAQATRVSLVGGATICGKSTRVLALCEDSSVRLFSRRDGRLLSTLLSPPDVSALGRVIDVCYSRATGLTFVLLDPGQLWVYFSRSNPACRLHTWSIEGLHEGLRSAQTSELAAASSVKIQELLRAHRACDLYWGPRAAPQCHSIVLIRCPLVRWSLASRELECPMAEEFLLLGVSDGRVLFLDPTSPVGRLHLQLQAHRGPVTRLHWDPEHECLLTGTEHKGVLTLAVWELPHLRQVSEFNLPSDCQCLVRCASSLVTGHASGHLIRNSCLFRPMGSQLVFSRDELDAALPNPEHAASVVAVDSLPRRSLLVSMDSSGNAKLWEVSEDDAEQQLALLAEFSLAERVASATFLNPVGDLLVSMRGHLFVVPVRRYLPQVLWTDRADLGGNRDDGSPAESPVLEDPAVVHEGVQSDPNPIDYDSYLAPFSVKLIKNYLAQSDLTCATHEMLVTSEAGEEAQARATAAAAAATQCEGAGSEYNEDEDVFEDDVSRSCSLTGLLDSEVESVTSSVFDRDGDIGLLIDRTKSVKGVNSGCQEEGAGLSCSGRQLPRFGESPGTVSPDREAPNAAQTQQPQPHPPPREQLSQEQQFRQSDSNSRKELPSAISRRQLKPSSTATATTVQSTPPASHSGPPPIKRLSIAPTHPSQLTHRPRQSLSAATVTLGSGLPSAAPETRQRRAQPPAKKVKKPLQPRHRKSLSLAEGEVQQQQPQQRPPTPEVAPAEFSFTEITDSIASAMQQQQQQSTTPRPSRSLVVEIPSLPDLAPEGARVEKRSGTVQINIGAVEKSQPLQRPIGALIFSSHGDEETKQSHPGTKASLAFVSMETAGIGEPAAPAATSLAADSPSNHQLPSSSASAITSIPKPPSLAPLRSAMDSQLVEQRQELESLRAECDRLAGKLAADFGTRDISMRNYGLKRLTPDELISLNNLKRLQRNLREQGALQRKAELRQLQLAGWEARANHGDCVTGPVPADTRPPPRMRTAAAGSRSTLRSEGASSTTSTAAFASSSMMRSQSAVEFRSAFQMSREATERSLTPSGASTASLGTTDRRARFGALPQTPYRLASPVTAVSSAASSPRDRHPPLQRDNAGRAGTNPIVAMRVRPGAASIPSRQYTYVLVRPDFSNSPEPESAMATLAEERLIRQRFPEKVPQWVGPQGVLEPKPWNYAISGFD